MQSRSRGSAEGVLELDIECARELLADGEVGEASLGQLLVDPLEGIVVGPHRPLAVEIVGNQLDADHPGDVAATLGLRVDDDLAGVTRSVLRAVDDERTLDVAVERRGGHVIIHHREQVHHPVADNVVHQRVGGGHGCSKVQSLDPYAVAQGLCNNSTFYNNVNSLGRRFASGERSLRVECLVD